MSSYPAPCNLLDNDFSVVHAHPASEGDVAHFLGSEVEGDGLTRLDVLGHVQGLKDDGAAAAELLAAQKREFYGLALFDRDDARRVLAAVDGDGSLLNAFGGGCSCGSRFRRLGSFGLARAPSDGCSEARSNNDCL